jgi:hypothetical protein
VAALAAAPPVPPSCPPPPPPPPPGRSGATRAPPERTDRAFAGLDSLLATFWSAQHGYLMEEVPSTVGPVLKSQLGYWNYQESLHALALGAGLAGGGARYGPRVAQLVRAQVAAWLARGESIIYGSVRNQSFIESFLHRLPEIEAPEDRHARGYTQVAQGGAQSGTAADGWGDHNPRLSPCTASLRL